tara:strand:+ start:186 stop:761 length:576 start_codon:yes stop_codon:yes gene_type:complete
MAKEKKSTYEIVQGLHQAAANAFDGAVDDKGEKLKTGLKREEGDAILDTRVLDGFGIKVSGNTMILSYHTECKVKEIHQMGLKKYQDEIKSTLKSVVSYLKKEYKKEMGSTVSLKEVGECDILIEPISKIRTSVKAVATYTVGGLEKPDTGGQPKSWEEHMKDIYGSLKEVSFEKSLKSSSKSNKLFKSYG